MKILVTGGAGYIGSHICLQLLRQSYEVVVFDNLCNGNREAIRRAEGIAKKSAVFYKADMRDRDAMNNIFRNERIDAVIHMAGLKAVGESAQKPLLYFENNITGTVRLLEAMSAHGVKKIVFSSSATVYGTQKKMPLTEDMPMDAVSPYGRTKTIIEEMLGDIVAADPDWSAVALRYFNPIGAYESGEIGEDPNGIPNNLMPFITQTAIGKQERLHIFGNDYDTPDGTCLRDYVHVMDLADGHIRALRALEAPGISVYNLGAGRGVSVLEILRAFEQANNIEINYAFSGRREGDAPVSYADTGKAVTELGWKAERTLEEMCRDSWNWQKKNPDGYGRAPAAATTFLKP